MIFDFSHDSVNVQATLCVFLFFQAAIFKKNILSFSGFPEENKVTLNLVLLGRLCASCSKGITICYGCLSLQEEEMERAREKLTDTTKDSLANFIHLLGLSAGGKKAMIVCPSLWGVLPFLRLC